MKHETSHILYEWEETGWYRSLIIHQLDQHGPRWHGIPENAKATPVWYNGYQERWYLANGRKLELPHKLFI